MVCRIKWIRKRQASDLVMSVGVWNLDNADSPSFQYMQVIFINPEGQARDELAWSCLIDDGFYFFSTYCVMKNHCQTSSFDLFLWWYLELETPSPTKEPDPYLVIIIDVTSKLCDSSVKTRNISLGIAGWTNRYGRSSQFPQMSRLFPQQTSKPGSLQIVNQIACFGNSTFLGFSAQPYGAFDFL